MRQVQIFFPENYNNDDKEINNNEYYNLGDNKTNVDKKSLGNDDEIIEMAD